MPEKLCHAELVSGLRRGDDMAIEQLCHDLGPPIIAFIRRRLKCYRLRTLYSAPGVFDWVTARLLAHLARGEYDIGQPQDLKKLLLWAAGRHMLTLARRRRRELAALGLKPADEAELEDVPCDREPSARAEVREALQRLRAAVTDWEWDLLNLRVEQRSWKEIASTLDGTPGGVQKAYKRLVRRLSKNCLH